MAKIKTKSNSVAFSVNRTVSSAGSQRSGDLNSEIQKKAYELFERRGYTSGNDLADWFEAERIILSSMRKR
ncbi:MAG: DUF2934 domain-containing protein [Candidatus Omnitrophica bacterium]|nr:DUF2934 domain-containing protein [Candidatus Omnitrophota bacterium]